MYFMLLVESLYGIAETLSMPPHFRGGFLYILLAVWALPAENSGTFTRSCSSVSSSEQVGDVLLYRQTVVPDRRACLYRLPLRPTVSTWLPHLCTTSSRTCRISSDGSCLSDTPVRRFRSAPAVCSPACVCGRGCIPPQVS